MTLIELGELGPDLNKLDRLQTFHFFNCFVGCTIKSQNLCAPSLLTVFHLLYKTGLWHHHQHPVSLVVVISLSHGMSIDRLPPDEAGAGEDSILHVGSV